jgi:hypothetical protein
MCTHGISVSAVGKHVGHEELFFKSLTRPRHYRLSDCPVPVKTDVGQVDLVSRLSDWTSKKMTPTF